MKELWMALTYVKGLGIKRIRKIYDEFPMLALGDLRDEKTLDQIGKIIKNKRVVEELSDYYYIKKQVEKAKESISFHEENGVQVIAISDEGYPALLHKIDDAPIVLYGKGNVQLLEVQRAIAVVGTRNPTEIGKKMARRIASHFAAKDYVIVSGLAIGIDTEAHLGALGSNGKTIAILAGGLESVFPKENTQLAESILQKGGLLLSEYPLHSPMFRAAFVQRDRIQSGISAAVCPVQTDIKGGTQHTISFAKAQNRFLFCPKPMEEVPATKGIMQLLEEGIFALQNTQDMDCIEEKIESKLRELLHVNKGEGKLICESQLDLFH
ncbi:DNA-processing protein DprA [Bacillus mobilis]|uniref:DNA protecting protein DprA n=2 Tax=Bacillus cereus group TaxID=86661 RepID=A0A1C4AA50_BACCE|nr:MULTISPECIES: DNA-processing protein DprA [Bacillus cereus group]OKA33822.1 DNA protecting protein DprA [Bacillus cereus]OKA34041.1 DNA protecting protein DprA [Bacillus cereus]SCB91340.1 DNA recombination mediator protein DprA [Bacillus mobilis]